jgi:hypothetical protein
VPWLPCPHTSSPFSRIIMSYRFCLTLGRVGLVRGSPAQLCGQYLSHWVTRMSTLLAQPSIVSCTFSSTTGACDMVRALGVTEPLVRTLVWLDMVWEQETAC